ncbi:hypothetical protein CKALI_11280 [Corynebacterium kalinowskii]|uniref:Uncharacterized protein n=1 Tax=Corynebacterium kalinowskii TaxID=2675216 RepID=A0A6B8W0H4_9CORY|nr:hypothetical protein [Corynebacterium kalinowskii]QGU03100.1 hypothetical protein CKALI_11280 [Corynebacterium kalinowskii]
MTSPTPQLSPTDFYTLKDKNDSLLLAALNVAVLMKPYDGNHLELDDIIASDGQLKQLPPEWFTFGEIEKKAGVDLAPDMKVEGPEGYGSRGRRRDFITDESFSIDFTAQETRLRTMEAYYDLDRTDMIAEPGRFFAKKRRSSKIPEWSTLLIGYDGEPGKEIYPLWYYPKTSMEKKGKQSLSDSNVLTWPMTFTAKDDPTYESLFGFGIAGTGFTKEMAEAMGITLTGGSGQATKTVTLPAGTTGGTWTLTVDGKTTAPIPYNADGAAVTSALAAAQSTATAQGSAGGPFTLSDATNVSANGNALTGGDTAIAIN